MEVEKNFEYYYNRYVHFDDLQKLYEQLAVLIESKRKFDEIIDIPDDIFTEMKLRGYFSVTDITNFDVWMLFQSDTMKDKIEATGMKILRQTSKERLSAAINRILDTMDELIVESYFFPGSTGIETMITEDYSGNTIADYQAFTGFSKRRINNMLRDNPLALADAMALGVENVIENAERKRNIRATAERVVKKQRRNVELTEMPSASTSSSSSSSGPAIYNDSTSTALLPDKYQPRAPVAMKIPPKTTKKHFRPAEPAPTGSGKAQIQIVAPLKFRISVPPNFPKFENTSVRSIIDRIYMKSFGE